MSALSALHVCLRLQLLKSHSEGTSQDFCPYRSNIPSSRTLHERECSCPLKLRDPHTTLSTVCSWTFLPSPQEHHCVPKSTPPNSADFQKLRISAPLFTTTCDNQFLMIPQSVVLAEFFSCVNPTHCPFSPSFSSLRKGLPPLCHTWLFFPLISLSLPCTCHVLSLKLYILFS